jgi:NAD(P)-dependent dehydrogenase (short-subunit alcohol dehydrogenase family)
VDLRLRDRVVVVTGGSSGVGRALVRLLTAEGALVATCARDSKRLARALDEDGLAESTVLAASCDVRDSRAVDRFIGSVVDRWGSVDGLVNNAGQSRMKRIGETTVEDWRDELELKFASVLNPLRSCLPHLIKSPVASVVNINAILAVQPDPRLITTSAARAGVLNLSKSLSMELGADNIRVNSVCLGLVDTGQWRRRFEQAGSTQTFDQWQRELARDRGVAMARLGSAEEVAAPVAMLLSPLSSYITGSALDIGGGISHYIH